MRNAVWMHECVFLSPLNSFMSPCVDEWASCVVDIQSASVCFRKHLFSWGFSSLFERHFIIYYVTFPRDDGSWRPPDFQSASSELIVTAFPSDSVCSAGAPWRLKAAWHERVREEGSDSAQQCVCGMQSGAAWDRRQHWLLALPGGGRHPASEPEHWHTHVNPLRPLESLFSGRWVTWMIRLLGDFLFLSYIHLQLFI